MVSRQSERVKVQLISSAVSKACYAIMQTAESVITSSSGSRLDLKDHISH